MPILEPPATSDSLDQGDLLRGVKLFLTGKTDALAGGESVSAKTDCCLVLSRPCVTTHKASVVVAAVHKFPSQTPSEVDTFQKGLHFLTKMREGEGSPDVFYLGQLVGQEAEGRFAARFDSLHTIEVPGRPQERTAFLQKHRFARLHADFRRDLHTRLFQAFAYQGFDDLTWFSTVDLRFLVALGKAELKTLAAEVDRLNAAAQADAGKRGDLLKRQNEITALEKRVAPYEVELKSREATSPPIPG